MRQQTVKNRRGFTLSELIVVIAIAPIVVLSIGIVLVDSQRGWNQMYNHVNNGVVSDGYVARKAFDAVVRKSSIKRERLGNDNDEVEVYYYNDPASFTELDRYARFYAAGTELLVDYGELNANGNPKGQCQTVTLARNVEFASFSVAGSCVQMTLRLDNGREALTVMTSAFRHYE